MSGRGLHEFTVTAFNHPSGFGGEKLQERLRDRLMIALHSYLARIPDNLVKVEMRHPRCADNSRAQVLFREPE